ncbi:superkiller [Collariella sp. IMI 366227]|nr:superkiller [Collariella sp. IMI 366227]
MSKNPTSPAPLSPTATLQLSRRKSSKDRIRDILEVSCLPDDLDGGSSRHHGSGVVTSPPERQRSLNYQGTAATPVSPVARRREVRMRKVSGSGSGSGRMVGRERTFLAWLRTSLAFASIGIAITQLFRLNTSLSEDGDTKHAEKLRHLGKPLGTTFLAVSILILLLGYNRYLQGQYWVIKGKFPASRGTIMLVSFIAFAVTLASLIVILAVQSNPA